MELNYQVLGIGAACIDLLIHVSDDFLKRIPGNKGGAEPIQWDQLEDILQQSQQTPLMVAGGSCANVIKCLSMLGEPCEFLSSIGNDHFGSFFSNYLKEQNIQGIFAPSPFPTSCVLCLVTPDGQRTMKFFEGSILSLTTDFLLAKYFKNIKHLHTEAYSLRSPGLVEKSMQFAKLKGALISMDLSSFEIVQEYRLTLKHLLNQYVDIVFANADEIRSITDLNPKEGCFELQSMCSVAVVTIGQDGCLVGHNNRIIHYPTFPASVIDSTGAGDFFAGGFLYGYLRKKPIEICAKWGNKLGSAIVEVMGAELPQEKWQILQPLFY